MLKTNLNETIERIVNQEILACQSSLVEAMLQNGMAEYEDIENMYIDNSREIEELEEKKEQVQEIYDELFNKDMNGEELTESEQEEYDSLSTQIGELDDQIEELEREQEEPQEVFEWWLVSKWLASKLIDNNEVILDNDYGIWWGRGCSGQAIKLDYVMEQIAKDLIK